MSNEQGQGWKGIFDGVSSPWDWAAIAAGAGVGAVATVVTGGAELGSSIAVGATSGLAAKKALEATFAKRQIRSRLRTKSKNLLTHLRKPSSKKAIYDALAKRLEDEIEIWEKQISSDAEFDKLLNEIISSYRAYRIQGTIEVPDNIVSFTNL